MVSYSEIELSEMFEIGIKGSSIDLLKASEVLDKTEVSWTPVSVGEDDSYISIGFYELFGVYDKLENVYPIIYNKTDPTFCYKLHQENFLDRGASFLLSRVREAVDAVLEENHPLKDEYQIECLVFSILTGVINDFGYSRYFIQVISEFLGELLKGDSFRGKAMKILY